MSADDDLLMVPLCELEYRQRIGYIEIARVEYCWGCVVFMVTPMQFRRMGWGHDRKKRTA